MISVKICGITTADDAITALEFGADMLGLNFYPPGPRYLDLNSAREVVATLPATAKVIGVFVDPDEAAVFHAVDRLRLAGVQLHGYETPRLISAIAARVPVIKAVRTLAEAQRALAFGAQILLDAPSRVWGGTGNLSDWILARELSALTSHFYLAGGLTADNVNEAVSLVRPFAVDVCSGVEVSPGRKSRSAMEAFVKAAKKGEANVHHFD